MKAQNLKIIQQFCVNFSVLSDYILACMPNFC